MSKKIGFYAIFALVVGSQIGSGILMLPTNLAIYGYYSIIGWLISGAGALTLAFVFSALCARFPFTGGPHVYVMNIFGRTTAFFVGWTYWVISWVSTTTLVITCIGYLTPIIGQYDANIYLCLEIILVIIITIINLQGLKVAGIVEFILTILKFIPLIIIPFFALYNFDSKNLIIDESVQNLSLYDILSKITLLTFWAFIGVETATTPAGSVINPTKNIPRAIILGTLCTMIIYIINSVSIMGLVNNQILKTSKAPYVEASNIIFSGNWFILVSLATSIICLGTLNAWTLSSGQIILGLAEDKLVPKVFAKKNQAGAPLGLLISSIGIIPLLIFTANDSFSTQILNIIDFSVIAFLFIYLICAIGLLKLLISEGSKQYFLLFTTIIAIIFCLIIIYSTNIKIILIASSFALSGIPIYLFYRKNIISPRD